MALTNTGYCDTEYHSMCPGYTDSRPQCMCHCHSFPDQGIKLASTTKPKPYKGKTNVKL